MNVPEPNTFSSYGNQALTPLSVAAAQLHEVYLSYVAAGFTPHQAMQLVCLVLHNAGQQQSQGDS